MQFVDEAVIDVHSGAGGNGCVSFRREKFVPRGGPDGGDGGDGGDVTLCASPKLTTLLDFHYQRHYTAKRGAHGKGKGMTGAAGASVVLMAPVGTVVTDVETGEELGDLDTPGARVVIARGGRGGKGNARFRSSTRQVPRYAEPGGEGCRRTVKLSLKLLADVGLVGLPNAGKSTLLAALSAARPKIADYPFTTLAPNLGVVTLGEYRSCVMADIPGLIEGAHAGHGLGHQFLRHIERTRVLLHLIDSTDADGIAAYHTIRDELAEYGGGCEMKPEIVLLTKIDALPPDADGDALAASFAQATGARPLAVSAVARTGLNELVGAIAAHVDAADEDDKAVNV